MNAIRFGTDGWRGVIARDFTFDNVGRVASAIAECVKSPQRRSLEVYRKWGVSYRPPEHGVVIGYDTRFLSKEFAVHIGGFSKTQRSPCGSRTSPSPPPRSPTLCTTTKRRWA
jgi:phosphomannomutase